MRELTEHQSKSLRLSMEKQDLSSATTTLRDTLADIEQRTRAILDEKANAELRLDFFNTIDHRSYDQIYHLCQLTEENKLCYTCIKYCLY